MNNFPSFIQALNDSHGGRFGYLYDHTSKSTGEICNRKIQIGFSYGDLLARAIVAASEIDVATVLAKCDACPDIETATDALTELRASYANRQANPRSPVLTSIDKAGRLKMHPKTGVIYITGLQVSRQVIKPGVHKAVQSADKTLVKRWIEKRCDRITDYRTLRLNPNSWDRFVYNGNIYTPKGFMSVE